MYFLRRLWLIVAGFIAASALSETAGANTRSPSKILLVAIGGNSECSDFKGIKKLYYSGADEHSSVKDGLLVQTIKREYGVDTEEIRPYYFSWTGDPEKHPGCLPGHWDWITGGSAIIRSQIPELERPAPGQTIVIVGWSNGGATAYELACELTRQDRSRVRLLVTLDPTSVTTRQCVDGTAPIQPAKRWISVYTASDGWSKLFDSGNIIAAIGGAWDNKFPAEPQLRARQLLLLTPANHGDTVPMWKHCVWASLTKGRHPATRGSQCRSVR